MTNMNDEIKRQLDAKAQNLSQPVQAKLAQARQKALLAAKEQAAHGNMNPAANDADWFKPLMALAACVCLIAPLWFSGVLSRDSDIAIDKIQFDLANQSQPSNLSPIEAEIELEQNSILLELAALNDDELELVENLDFALWLLQQEQVSS